MATPPVFSAGGVLTAAQMNAVGLWEIKSETIGTGVASFTVSTVFSSDYDNYKIVINNMDASANAQQLRMTFGAAATAYYGSAYYDKVDGTSTGLIRSNNAAYVVVGLTGTNDNTNVDLTVYGPNLTKATGVSGMYNSDDHMGWASGQLRNTTAYTAFTITAQSGTFTGGTVRVYGIRN